MDFYGVAYSRGALIRERALIRINTVLSGRTEKVIIFLFILQIEKPSI